MKTTILTCLLAVGAASSIASADRIVRINGGPSQSGDGGEFRITPISGGSVGVTGMASDRNNSSFQTFCIERNQLIILGREYVATVDTAADHGGVAGGTPDPISVETAYLYSAFRKGTLPSQMMQEGQARRDQARALQLAFWLLEEEITEQFAEYANNSAAQSLVAFAESTTWDNIRGVRVLNLINMDGEQVQSQLTLIPLPTTAGLAGLGLVAVGSRRRR